MMHIILSLTILSFSVSDSLPQKASFFFPEYKHYFKPDNDCARIAVQSIWGSQYLKIRLYDNCNYVELSCYRSKDSTLKEEGIYYNTNQIFTYSARGESAGSDSAWVTKKSYALFKRIGTWKFYNKTGRVIKVIRYKKPDL